jgi:U3 small nucleolar RNA-associated protein 14
MSRWGRSWSCEDERSTFTSVTIPVELLALNLKFLRKNQLGSKLHHSTNLPANMARIARSSVSEAKPKNARNKSKKRSLQAFSIASSQIEDNHKIRKHRLGEIEDDGPRRKRARSEDEEDEDDDEEEGASTKRPQKKTAKGRFDEMDVSSGSDSEGNRWKLGVVDDDDDEDIDSDEAFGESDEERFAGYTFRGSTGGKSMKKKKKTVQEKSTSNFDVDLDEESSHVESDSDDSLGEDAVDLATMLDDDYESDDEEDEEDERKGRQDAKRKARDLVKTEADNSSSEQEEEEDLENILSDAMSDIAQEDDEDQLARLQDLVSGLQPAEDTTKRKHREADPHEARAPSTSGLISSEKFDIKDFLASTSDPQIKKMSKQLGTIPKTLKKDPKLAPSLPKRQKDKLERVAANEKAKETLDRWVDTVKHNRRADHLSFPLIDPESAKPHGSRHLVPTNLTAPMNDLEDAIHNILQESGLATANADEEEERLQKFEELKTNKMPLEEVQARRAELRRARDLLFREELRAKRVKKIKSKAYRRVHRKERERLDAMDRDAFAEGGEGDLDEEDRDQADRRRAEERMGAKHRDSKWAKQMKKSGRTVWDEDAKSGVSEMAQRNEELRRRIEGKEVHNDEASDAEPTFSSDDEDGDDVSDLDGEAAEFQSLQRQLNRVDGPDDLDASGPGSRLGSMKFMKQAEATRKARNDEEIAQMRKELAGENGSDESEQEESVGRKIFGPTKKIQTPLYQPEVRNEFEEPDEEEWTGISDGPPVSLNAELPPTTGPKLAAKLSASELPSTTAESILKKQGIATDTHKKKSSPQPELLPGEKHTQPDTDGWITVTYNNESDASDKDAESEAEAPLDQAEILRRAFAGDDVEDAFEIEKATVIADEDEKLIDDTLPGWGSWVGEGLSKRDKQRNTGRWFRKEEGIKPAERKDAKLKHVIVNQKRVKKNVSYMAGALPFPFTNRAEYERSIRMPIGSEWNVKETFQESTKPRVLVKPGSVIKPMEKPMV